MSFEERQVGDAQTLRALSHPLRLRLLDLLEQSGPLTATEAAARVDTSPSNCSFHMRLLARHGYVEEAPGGVGRNRPWKTVDQETKVRVDELDADGRVALRAVIEVMAERDRHHALNWLRIRDGFDAEWRDAAGDTHTVLHLTAGELATLSRAFEDAIAPYAERSRRRRPGTAPISVVLSALPTQLPTEESHDDVS